MEQVTYLFELEMQLQDALLVREISVRTWTGGIKEEGEGQEGRLAVGLQGKKRLQTPRCAIPSSERPRAKRDSGFEWARPAP